MSAGAIWLVSILATIAFVLLWIEITDRRQRRRERQGRQQLNELDVRHHTRPHTSIHVTPKGD